MALPVNFKINVDPNRTPGDMRDNIPQVVNDAVRGGNTESSARMSNFGGTEYMIRGRGYANSIGGLRRKLS